MTAEPPSWVAIRQWWDAHPELHEDLLAPARHHWRLPDELHDQLVAARAPHVPSGRWTFDGGITVGYVWCGDLADFVDWERARRAAGTEPP